MSDKYGLVLLFYTGIIILFVTVAVTVDRHALNLESQEEQINETLNQVDSQLDQKIPRIALTFDDGPSYFTTALLSGLKERGVHASFFLMGKNIEGKEDIVQQIYQDGHLIGNHTYDHVDLTAIPDQEACRQITKTCNLIYSITGYYTTFVRPPYGLWPEDVEYHVTMIPVMWTIDSMDWTTSDVDGTVKKVVSSAQDGGIILMHDNYDSSVESALRIVDTLLEKGYQFVTVDELLYE